jgi:hypothetical protein
VRCFGARHRGIGIAARKPDVSTPPNPFRIDLFAGFRMDVV